MNPEFEHIKGLYAAMILIDVQFLIKYICKSDTIAAIVAHLDRKYN